MEDAVAVAKELQRDFEETCLAIATDVASSDDPTQWLDVIATLEDNSRDETLLPSDMLERLNVDFLPQIVQLLLSKSFHQDAVDRVNGFFRSELETIAKRLRLGDTSRLPCLNRILDVHRRFYLYHGTGSDHNQDEESETGNVRQSFQFAARDSSEYTSKYFLCNLEYWGQLDGFALFVEILRNGVSPSHRSTSRDSSFDAMQAVLRTLYAVKDHLYPGFLNEYFSGLVDAVRDFIRDLPADEFYALPRDSHMEVVQILELLLVKIQHDALSNEKRDAYEQRVQVLRLDISLRFFQSTSLEKRIYGLTEIVVVITRLYNDQIQTQPEPTAASLHATLSYLVEWMHEKRLMQDLLGDKIHVELIKRSTSLFQFVSELECLPTEWIDLVWNCYRSDTEEKSDEDQPPRPTRQRHEAFRSAIQDLLLEMVEFLELPSLIHLVSRIETIKSGLDSSELNLLAAVAARRLLVEEQLGKQFTLRQRILMHLWKAVLPFVNSEHFRDEILLRMHEILRLDVEINEAREIENELTDSGRSRSCLVVNEFLSLCASNIHRRNDLVISLKLLTQLGALISEVGITPSVEDPLEKSCVQIVLDEVEEYKQTMRQRLHGTEWPHMSDEERTQLPVLKEYVNDIKTRLLALRASWILSQRGNTRDVTFTKDQVDVIWELMVVDAFLLGEAALCFQWIELCLKTPPSEARLDDDTTNVLMPLSMAKYLLMNKFRGVPANGITLSMLCCFHSIFRHVNVVEGGLELFSASIDAAGSLPTSPTGKTDGDSGESIELVTGVPLVGLEELWHLAITASDATVAEEIITLLASYHLAFMPGLRHTELPFQSKMKFLEKCMEFLTTAKANAEQNSAGSNRSEADTTVVNRCVDLLRYFLEASTVGDDVREEEDAKAFVKRLKSEQNSPETNDDNGVQDQSKFQLEHLEERLPYMEIYPSPMKDMRPDATTNAMLGIHAARRPSWTFRQQHSLLDVIEDTNEEVDPEDIRKARKRDTSVSDDDKETTRSAFAGKLSPLKIDPIADFLRPGSPIKPGTRSPCMRANLRWPQAPSPQHGPDLRSEDIDRAIANFSLDSFKDREMDQSIENTSERKAKTKYGIISQILANHGSYFDVLFDLVDWGETTSQRTWDLLCRLPTNNTLLGKMIRLRSQQNDEEDVVSGGVEWSELLDGSNIHRLLYSLRLVEALLVPIEQVRNGYPKLDSARRQWRERFVRLGGTLHLYNILLQWPHQDALDTSLSSQCTWNLRATCLAAVMRVLSYFFQLIQLSITEKTQLDKLPPFDLQLRRSTLPEFVESIKLLPVLQAAVQLPQQSFYRNFQHPQTFSDEVAEAVCCSVQLTSSLLRISPELMTMVFSLDPVDATTGSDKNVDLTTCGTLTEWLKFLLIECPSGSMRGQVLKLLSDMAKAFSNDYRSTSRKVFEHFVVTVCELVAGDPSSAIDNAANLDEVFSLCETLLESCKRVHLLSQENSEIISEALLKKSIPERFVQKLSQIVGQEQILTRSGGIRQPRHQCEGVLNGYLRLVSALASISEQLRTNLLRADLNSHKMESSRGNELVIEFIMKHLLLGELSDGAAALTSPVCKSSVSRELAQRFVSKLVFPPGSSERDRDVDLLLVLNHLRDYQARVLNTMNSAGRPWNHAPSDSLLDPFKNIRHAGLVNPGCICYMNSLIQQLFMIPSFCEGLLALDCMQSADEQQSSWKEEILQLQKLFVRLAYANRRSGNPTAFALSHKDMEGQSTDVHLQMDADEFFSLLLDRVEMFIRPQTKPSEECKEPGTDFMRSCFGGVLVNQILTQQGNLSEREEKFFALSLEVSKKRYLTESLALYVQGETLEGENAYFCERVQQKVSATKRVCIKKLPQTLVCHLKRFEFDYSTMEKLKLNDYLEFPTEIDMYPYTRDALTNIDSAENNIHDLSIMYDLVGVVVHSGTADTGHYYSFIKDRRDNETQRWLEFNDEVVREFDVDTMADECFGGEEVAQRWDPIPGISTPIVQMKRRSAYMLIYERRSKSDRDHTIVVSESYKVEQPDHVKALVMEIRRENLRYESVANVFEPSYEHFVCDLVENVTRLSEVSDSCGIREAYQLACQFLFGISSLRYRTVPAVVSPSNALRGFSNPKEPDVHAVVSSHVATWLADYNKNCHQGDADKERVVFSKWVLAEVVAPPSVLLSPSPVESQRSWLFDIFFFGPADPQPVESCFRVLLAAVNIFKHRAVMKDKEAEQSLLAFFREVLNLFYDRELSLDVRDPVSGSFLTVSLDARVDASKQLGVFLCKCIGKTETSLSSQDGEIAVLRNLLLEKLQFVSRFLLCLQISCDDYTTNQMSSHARRIAPLAIETNATSFTTMEHLRFCTFRMEMEMLKHLLDSQPQLVPPVDDTLLLNHTALKNVLALGLDELLMPVLARIAFETASTQDRLVTLLIGLLEEVKESHSDKLLNILGALLAAGEAEGNAELQLQRHVFSPTRGILESVMYYRDRHAHREYVYHLLEFVVHHTSQSPALQELFRSDVEFHDHISWISNWLADYLDSNGEIQKRPKASKEEADDKVMNEHGKSAKEVQKIFDEVERAFGVASPACDGHNGDQASLAVAAEDVVLRVVGNQGDAARSRKGSDDSRPEAQTNPRQDWKTHKSREELATLLRLDLDATHNNAREA